MVQVLTVKTGEIHPTDLRKLSLFQLATRLGHELDYSLIAYESPDFWLKQKLKTKERNR